LKREILINAAPRETRIAILEDGKLVELLVDRPDNRRMVGDIYLGRVDAVLPGRPPMKRRTTTKTTTRPTSQSRRRTATAATATGDAPRLRRFRMR
jgi:hypothetical protein